MTYTYTSEASPLVKSRSYEVKDASVLSLLEVMAELTNEWGDIDISIHVPVIDERDEMMATEVVIFTDADEPYAVITVVGMS